MLVLASRSSPASVTFARRRSVETEPAAAAASVHAIVSIASASIALASSTLRRPDQPTPIPRRSPGRIHGDRRIHGNREGRRRLRVRFQRPAASRGTRPRRHPRSRRWPRRSRCRRRRSRRSRRRIRRQPAPDSIFHSDGLSGSVQGNVGRVRRHRRENGRRIIRRAARPVGVALRPRLRRALFTDRARLARAARAEHAARRCLALVGRVGQPIDELSELAMRRRTSSARPSSGPPSARPRAPSDEAPRPIPPVAPLAWTAMP